jgi:hypothetical protein
LNQQAAAGLHGPQEGVAANDLQVGSHVRGTHQALDQVVEHGQAFMQPVLLEALAAIVRAGGGVHSLSHREVHSLRSHVNSVQYGSVLSEKVPIRAGRTYHRTTDSKEGKPPQIQRSQCIKDPAALTAYLFVTVEG